MTRKTYFYCLIVLGTLLNVIIGWKDMLGVSIWLTVNALLIVIAWGCVWMRLFTTGKLRPELSILSVLPTALYVYFRTFGEPLLAHYTEFFHLLAWAAAAAILLASIRPTLQEKAQLEGRDLSGIIMTVLSITYCIASWAASSFSLFLPSQL